MTTVRRRKRMSSRGFAWMLVSVFAFWPLVALTAGYEASWPMIIATSIASAGLVWLLDHRKPKRRRITTLPKSNMAKPARPNGMKALAPLTKSPELATPRTRLRAKLAAAAELAELHEYGDELQALWRELDVADAATADLVTQREIEYPVLELGTGEVLSHRPIGDSASGKKLTEWLRDSDAKHRREAS